MNSGLYPKLTQAKGIKLHSVSLDMERATEILITDGTELFGSADYGQYE